MPPVSVLGLFRFATKFELMLNFLGVIASTGAGGATPIMTLFLGNLIESFVNISQTKSLSASEAASFIEQFRQKATQDALNLVYLGIAMFLATYISVTIWTYTGEVIAKRIRESYFRAILHQDLSFFDDISAGEVAAQIEVDAHLVQQGISEKFALLGSNVGAFATGMIIAYIKSWRLALALTSMLPCLVIIGALMAILCSRCAQASLSHLSKAGGIAQESLSTIRIIHAFGAEIKISTVYDQLIRLSQVSDLKLSKIQGVGMAIFSFVVYSSYSLSFYYGTTLIQQGRANAGTVVTVGLCILIGSFSLGIAGPNAQVVMRARDAAAQLYRVIDHTPMIDSRKENGQKLTSVQGEIVLKNIDFSYPSRRNVPVLKYLSLTFPAGKRSALVGHSGSGKSTIVGLLERFYDPDAGSVFLDGVDLCDLHIKWLRSQIGLVAQEPVLFAISVRENIEQGLLNTAHEHSSREIRWALVQDACIKAYAHDFIMLLPEGYDTMVGDGGFRLSGGQKQRIAIARAIVSDPRILLLDEATSALDTQSEGIVQAALNKASEGRTTITIAHRLSTVKDSDVIYVLSNGSLVESGTHEELLCDDHGAYTQLVRAQHLDQDDASVSQSLDIDAEETKGHTRTSFVNKDIDISNEEDLKSTLTHPSTDELDRAGRFTLAFKLASLIPHTRMIYVCGTFFGILGGLVHPGFGIVYAKALQTYQNTGSPDFRTQGDRNALWLFIIAICSTLSLAMHNVLFGKGAAILTTKLRLLAFQGLLHQEISFFDKDSNNPGVLTANLVGGPEKTNGFVAMTLGAVLQCISCCIGGSIIGLIFGWKLALVGIACMPPIVTLGLIRLQLVANKEKASKASHDESAQIACEAAVSIRTVAALTREDHTCSLYSDALKAPLRQSVKAGIVSNAIFAMSISVIVFVVALVFWYGSGLVTTGEYTTFQFYVVFMSTVFGSWNAANVFTSVPDITSAADAARDILKIMKTSKSNIVTNDEKAVSSRMFENVQGGVHFQDVSFCYPTRPEVSVLRGINLSIKPGAYTAFVGASGSGKSTIIQLIERFYEPTSGSIYFDENCLSALDVNEYRKHVALVSQESKLYSGTIRFNILLGSTGAMANISDEEIKRACSIANILDFIESLPNGFETEVGERGSQLSGGQKQRIAIARALIRNPKLLLLDEATSALDANSEVAVQEALNNAAKGRTTIAIAHKLATVQHADHIYFIKDGKVNEMGTHGQLMARRGGYWQFAKLQELEK
ncbi:hypothetical protein SERLA73DRAFT_170797 [Serpula lacrymans var. lacrymans S7.3]|uniref:Uncharacterized protein n=1 Tax=Serpula lacrymans var. lacrymans (strain S7.3) TaxID=936435 RepID=F8Q5E8_SERL3|nr:hypothetical protein SERLA73DRAFT_170797 [Serpula lacrymans var. lacrymans S7.3]